METVWTQAHRATTKRVARNLQVTLQSYMSHHITDFLEIIRKKDNPFDADYKDVISSLKTFCDDLKKYLGEHHKEVKKVKVPDLDPFELKDIKGFYKYLLVRIYGDLRVYYSYPIRTLETTPMADICDMYHREYDISITTLVPDIEKGLEYVQKLAEGKEKIEDGILHLTMKP